MIQSLTNDDYKKPPVTYTDSLSKDDIKNFLKDYEQVEDINKIKKGTHLRYFSKCEDGMYKFRLGGKLIVNSTLPDYIVLSSKTKKWCVQIKSTIFYAKKK
jgi:hypothetical protein